MKDMIRLTVKSDSLFTLVKTRKIKIATESFYFGLYLSFIKTLKRFFMKSSSNFETAFYKMGIRIFLFLLCAFTNAFLINAQNEGGYNTLTKGQSLNEVDFTHAISTKVVTELDIQWNLSNDTLNRANIWNHTTQVGGRGWLHWYLHPRVKLSYGFGYWKNMDVPEARQYDYNDFRSTVQLIYLVVAPRITLSHRLRFEDRFVQNQEHTDYDHSWRLWYGPKLTYCLNSKVIRKKTVYLILSDEVFVIPKTGYWIDQNRFVTGAGYSFTSDLLLELTYSRQRRLNIGADEITNAIGLTLTINNVTHLFSKKQ